MIEVEVNGVLHEFPEGTSQETIRVALQKKYAPASKNTFLDGPLAAGVQAAGQALTFNGIDEVADGIIATARSMALPGSDKWKQEYMQAREVSQPYIKQLQENNPLSSLAGGVTGGILGAGAIGATKAGRAAAGMLGSGTTGARIAKGILSGGGVGAAYGAGGAETGERLRGAGEGGLLGAAIGGAVPAVSAGIGAVKDAIGPSIDDAAKETAKVLKTIADKHKIPLSVDDVVDSDFYKRLIAQGEKLPFSGAKKSAAEKQTAINRAVSRTLGEESDKITPEYLNKVRKSLGNDFESFTKGKVFTPNTDLYTKLDDITNAVSRGDYGSEGAEFLTKYKSEIENLIDPSTGAIKGDRLDKIRREFAETARKQGMSNIGQLAGDFEDLVVDIISDSDPKIAKAITDAKYKYKNYKTIIGIAKKDQNTGDINPVLLANRVSQKFGEDAFATGRAGDLGEIARIGQALRMPSTSGTAENIIANALLTGGAGVAYGTLGAPGVAGLAAGTIGNRMLQNYNRNPAVLNKIIQGGTNLPALQGGNLYSPIGSGMLGGYIGAEQ